MKYLLDTNVLIELTKRNQVVRQRAMMAGLDNCFTSEISVAELLYGAYKAGIERHYHELSFFKDHLPILKIGPCLDCYARIKVELESQGKRLDNFDLLIAATAITSDLTLVTHNTRHFERIPELRVIDWEKD